LRAKYFRRYSWRPTVIEGSPFYEVKALTSFGDEMLEVPEPLKLLKVISDYGEIEGKITIHRLIHNLQKNRALGSGYKFIAYSFGPYSKELDEDLKILESLGLIKEVRGKDGVVIKITKKGIETIKNLRSITGSRSKVPS